MANRCKLNTGYLRDINKNKMKGFKHMHKLNMVGRPCPEPVVEAKKYISSNNKVPFMVTVDNKEAVQNLSSLAAAEGYSISCEEKSSLFELTFEPISENENTNSKPEEEKITVRGVDDSYIIVLNSDSLGEATDFGKSLMRSFLYALSESNKLPLAILMYNRGVMLSAGDDEEILSDLLHLQDKSVKILSCGLCLDNFALKDKLKVGQVTNMYEIVSMMSKYRVVKP